VATARRLIAEDPRSLDVLHVISKIPSLGPREDKMLSNILSALKNNPEAISIVASPLRTYFQIRYMYEYGGIWGQSNNSTREAESKKTKVLTMKRS
jgi:hypothetical protein